jgi:hypothetical protein
MKHKILSVISGFIIILAASCGRGSEGPFFGNGFHNGWADQNSIVIWTRLTKTPELNRKGPKFMVPSAQEHRRLDKMANPDSIYRAQIPEGYKLDQMEGACPGSDVHAEGWNQSDFKPEHRFLRVKGGYHRGTVNHNNDEVIIKFQHCDVDGNVVHEESFVKQI